MYVCVVCLYIAAMDYMELVSKLGLSMYQDLVREAGLVTELNSMRDRTLFVPDNQAWAGE